jgi:hypothetical protein
MAEDLGNLAANERFTAPLPDQVRAQVLRLAKEVEHLASLVAKTQELLDEALAHRGGRVFVRAERDAVQLQRIVKIGLGEGHLGFRI